MSRGYANGNQQRSELCLTAIVVPYRGQAPSTAPARGGSKKAPSNPSKKAPGRGGGKQVSSHHHQAPTAPARGGGKQVSVFQPPSRVESYQKKCQASHVDKLTGSYQRATSKQEASTGQVFKERGSGRIGYKDELKNTTTVRIGDRYGYDEYQVEERFRRVNFGNSSKKGGGSGSRQKYLSY